MRVASLLALSLAARVAAAQAPEPAPDPRRGERLDGRPAPEESGARQAARIVAAPARAAAWLVLTPVDRSMGFAERHKIRPWIYEALTSDDRLVGLHPVVYYEPGYAIAGGLRYFDRRSLGPGSLVEADVRGGARSFQSSFALAPPGTLGLELRATFSRRSDAIFAGTTGASRAELAAEGRAVARYRFNVGSLVLAFRRRVAGPFGLDVTTSAENRVFSGGTSVGGDPSIEEVYCVPGAVAPCAVDPAAVPGFDEGVRLLRAQVALDLDTRAHPRFAPGVHLRLGAGYARGVAGDPSRHGTVTAMLEGVLPFGDHSLTLRVQTGVVEPLASAPVPFDELLVASGPPAVRGLPRGRLRGRSLAVASLEYRWLVAPWLDAMLFVDRGNAFGPRFDGFALGETFMTFGLGVIVLRADDPRYWRFARLFDIYVAATRDEGLRVSFAFNFL